MAVIIELVWTNSFTDGSFSAASRMEVVPAMVCGITLFGSGSKVEMVARWAMADMPFTADTEIRDVNQLEIAAVWVRLKEFVDEPGSLCDIANGASHSVASLEELLSYM